MGSFGCAVTGDLYRYLADQDADERLDRANEAAQAELANELNRSEKFANTLADWLAEADAARITLLADRLKRIAPGMCQEIAEDVASMQFKPRTSLDQFEERDS